MKKVNKNKFNYKLIILLACLVIAVLTGVCIFLKDRSIKNEQAKNDALVMTNLAIRKYIEDKGYENENNIAFMYQLNQLDRTGDVLKCPFNGKPYDADSSALVDYNQFRLTFSTRTYLYCGNRAVVYSCTAENDIYESHCSVEIVKR